MYTLTIPYQPVREFSNKVDAMNYYRSYLVRMRNTGEPAYFGRLTHPSGNCIWYPSRNNPNSYAIKVMNT